MKRGYGFGILAHPETKRVRVWVRSMKLELKPREARGLAFTLLQMADVAERRRIPNASKESK